MKKRSTVSFGTIYKSFQILAPHPWITSKLLSLQLAKWLFPFPNFQVAAGRARKIYQVSIRITDICNLRCHTCGQWGDNGFMHGRNLREHRLAEVSPERYLEVFADLVTNGHRPNIYIWGGEPMLYGGILPVIEGATQRGLPVSIATNGQTLAECADQFAKIPLFLLQVSIDGHNRDIHNTSRPSAGEGDSFAAIESGLLAMKEAKRKNCSGLPIVASLTVISKQNINHLVDIFHTFKDSVDIFVFYLSWWIDEAQAKRHEDDFRQRFGFTPQLHWGWVGNWRPDDFAMLSSQLTEVQRLAQSPSSPAVTILPHITSAKDLERYYSEHSEKFGFNQCISIFQAVELNSNGNMSPCRDYHDYIVGNIKDDSIVTLWNCEKYTSFRRSIRSKGLMPVCNRCCGLMGY
jgi:radical SAM protein with 4Fe4S-binding SPASM domain